MENRINRKQIAANTLDIIDDGIYCHNGKEIDIDADIDYSIDNTEYHKSYANYNPEYKPISYKLDVRSETTVEGIRRISKQDPGSKIIVLNFASARHPGGGFLEGAAAQEESLARASSLYPTLLEFPDFYNSPVAPYYTDKLIYSPDVIFFKNDKGQTIEPVKASVITCAAPNLNTSHIDYDKIERIFLRRIYNILKLSQDKNYQHVILGAWGCGVFKNNPKDVKNYFAFVIENEFKDAFKSITFSIYDTSGRILREFNS